MITLITRILYRAIPLLWFYVISKVRMSHCLIAATFFMVGSLANGGDLNVDGVMKRYDSSKTSFVNFWNDLNGVKTPGEEREDDKVPDNDFDHQNNLTDGNSLKDGAVEITSVDYSPFE